MTVRRHVVLRTFLVAVAVLMAMQWAGVRAQQSQQDESPTEQIKRDAIGNYEERKAARDALADLLASDAIERLDFVATSMDQAMRRVDMVAEPFFADAYARLGDVEAAKQQCTAVIQGFNDHTIRLSSVGRMTGAIEITSDADARLAGELFTAVARLVERLEPKIGEKVPPRRLARKIFSQTTIYETSAASPIAQYLETVAGLAERSDEQLLRYFDAS
jgi:hypothetical protein